MWAQSRDRLADACRSLGFPGDLADLLAKQLGSPKGIDRMTDWLYHARPRSMEMIVDEMLAICADIEAWRKKKESQEAQYSYSRWLNSAERLNEEE
ncbi:MAG: hypothetical protein IKZ98_10375 [Clostridia bacterium]|nr:hypothetical protein [Clostridia bacterium]